MPLPTSPVVAAWELALRLRQQRDQTGTEVRVITQALGFSRNYWSAVENERKILSEESLIKLVELLEFDAEERQELLELRAAAKERGWWMRYGNLLDSDLQRLIGLEASAETVRCYESLLIPGLLQTADYARAIMTPDATIRKVEVDQRVEVRLRRQRRLVDESPLRLVAIVSEAALRQQIGGPAVLRHQLEQLARSIEGREDRLEVRVIPFTATACGLFGAATVHLIEFPNPRLPTVVWQETVTTRGVIDDAGQVRDIMLTYQDALKHTLSAPKSLELIHQRIKELD
ncbi:helix-turn-helix domain-containing protein [Lentzea sp. PSKA42]|uniref:Helix-turn-helix domain-containing protein n=1 Tax=Lentzea indica TaxID=2604800 RepID=A0ABX1FT18_9PSEU|nr:Scr1 family TA system antitoxin-like transcriptional regulator [Lentzea indica]NKE62147.1 helix-turn-helix domain-containing protein [Lentzea indica]